jgi:gluconate kinase
MVSSQFAELEPPGPGERTVVVASDRPPERLADEIIADLGLR